jgi:hypothetical protein
MPPAGPRATAFAPIRCPSRWYASAPPSRVERGQPASLVILSQWQVEALSAPTHQLLPNTKSPDAR